MVKQTLVRCGKCYEGGYLVSQDGEFATAELCTCVKNCPECGGSGLILAKNEKGYTFVTPCKECGIIRRNVKLYNLACVPARYSHVLQVDAGLVKMNKSQQVALKYAKEEFIKKYPTRRGFLLMGWSGLGKTHLAVGTISELTLKHGIKCLFKDFFYLLSELKKAYSEGISENEVLFPLIETEVLVIDELGKGKSNEWELNILDQLISKRYNASKLTLITTNFISRDHLSKHHDQGEKEILEQRVGERIASRLYEMCEFIYLEGRNDFRKTKNI